ncbi:formyltetrahydrofolate deformylase [Pseudogulbenkiania subflava]|uniref:Formyltetrahydrofolate deformylase n=1 Tax=Pseudogulbenkiania subflava DSM 22618 TaxID=1123014 RepID=A0A1Y6BT43_9NEIS|nr:formyltetrahydrofolate deformylase [Pseudogulbenkiania subflava]SMF27530.1 formyltetrahydrofolate deformylase [Pseudogulbenkiania subflava DSM 22618]
MSQSQLRYILAFTCKSAPGQIARASQLLDAHHCYIDELAVFDDEDTQRFFVRCTFHSLGDGFDRTALEAGLADMAGHYDMQWTLHDTHTRPRVLIMVSKLDHCLNDLLYRCKMGDLDMEVTAIVSNHADLAPIAAAHGLPYHHLPVTHDTKPQQEAALLDLVRETHSELVILARYMQVLSPEMSKQLSGRAINIHHSFLPGFKGAKPYHQAHERGVKLIGATAHYITDDLDEGPIIEQVVERVDHAYRPEQLLAAGRDMECLALARAVRFHLERRVFLNGNRTVVLR